MRHVLLHGEPSTGMRRLFWLILLCLPLASAQIVSDASDGGAEFKLLPAKVAFIDADKDGRIDHGDQEEPIYIDAHDDGVLNRGDIRLTGHFGEPGTSVQLGDADFGLDILDTSAWFARSGDAWFLDTDGSRTISAGDLRLDGAEPGRRVLSSDGDVGRSSPAIQTTVDPSRRIGWTDPDRDGRVDPGEGIYIDLEYQSGTAQTTAVGDLVFLNRISATDADIPGTPDDADDEAMGATGSDGAAGDEGPDWGLILGIVDLVGLIGLAAWVAKKG